MPDEISSLEGTHNLALNNCMWIRASLPPACLTLHCSAALCRSSASSNTNISPAAARAPVFSSAPSKAALSLAGIAVGICMRRSRCADGKIPDETPGVEGLEPIMRWVRKTSPEYRMGWATSGPKDKARQCRTAPARNQQHLARRPSV